MAKILAPNIRSESSIKMEERQYASLTVPTDYLQHWFPSTQHVQALQVTQYHQMAEDALFMEAPGEHRVMTEMMVHQEPSYTPLEPPYTPQEPPYAPHEHPAPMQGYPLPPYGAAPGYYADRNERQVQPLVYPAAPVKGKRGRPPSDELKAKQERAEDGCGKVKRKVDRFNGMSPEEVMTKTLPDILAYNLDMLIIGINPGLLSAYKGRHYPNPGNHFWKCLFLSGITEVQLNHMHDQTLPEKYGIGFTNMVERTTPGSKDLTSQEFRDGGRILVEKVQKYRPLIAVFNGKCIYEIFSKEIFGVKSKKLDFGLQPHKIPETDTVCYLMPSSSPRCSQFPRAQDKVQFFLKLKDLRDQLKGVAKNEEVEEIKYSFDLSLAKEDAKRLAIKEEKQDPGYEPPFSGSCGKSEQQSNGHCSFSYPETRPGETVPSTEATPLTSMGRVLDGQWMMQSFADQIPDIAGSSTQSH
ncbi:G/T mismatch-specific thymine DNA glycosylase-like isoform X2 [Anguilla rostrata]|uniref:G/T mismatch-specific thymine DNA glycosylase-like isoform X2 n=1 Tax=Anguilla rostrata TaxID=7938 RepID=UPI0030D09E58